MANRAEVEGRARDIDNDPERGNKIKKVPFPLRSGRQAETRAKQEKD